MSEKIWFRKLTHKGQILTLMTHYVTLLVTRVDFSTRILILYRLCISCNPVVSRDLFHVSENLVLFSEFGCTS